MKVIIDTLENRTCLAATVDFQGFAVAWNSTGVLRINGPDRDIQLSVTLTTLQNAAQNGLKNVIALPGVAVLTSTFFCVPFQDNFEELRFFDGATYDDVKYPLASYFPTSPVVFITADNGLNILAPADEVLRINISTGDQNDSITIGKMNRPRVVVNGGAGNDTIISSARKSTLNGEAGNDLLFVTRAESPVLRGGAGKDRLFATGSIFANIDGGKGSDTSDFRDSTRVENIIS